MRISSQMFYMRNTNSLMDKQSKLNDQNAHLAAQKRVIHGSDDPVAIATIQRLKQDLSVGEQYIKNGEIAQTANELTDTALTQVTNILQRVRELMVSGSNGTLNEENRDAIAIELETLRDELIGVANAKDGNGQYIFAGFQVNTQPFQKNEFGEVVYHGDDGERDYRIGSGVLTKANDPGSKVFMDIIEGNGSFVSELGSNNSGGGVISEGSVVDENKAAEFADQDYTIAITDPTGSGEPDYSVYGLKDDKVSGSANVKVSQIDLDHPDFAGVNPSGTYPAADSDVKIEFVQIEGTDTFEVQINGKSSLPEVYDAANTNGQEISISGITIEVDGLPDSGDSYELTKFVPPTPYEEGQAISFNGIKTEIKGGVADMDSFTLRKSEEKDIFSTIQGAIDGLRIPGDDAASQAERTAAFNNSLLQIDSALDNVVSVQAAAGSRLNTIDNQREATLDFNLTTTSSLSSLEDLDMAAAITEFQQQMSMLEITQKTFVQMQQISLFNLI